MKRFKGQITQDFALAIVIMLAFVTLVLVVESEVLPKIWEKQLAESERIKNIYRCAAIDTLDAFQTKGIPYPETNGTCLTQTESMTGKLEIKQKIKKQLV